MISSIDIVQKIKRMLVIFTVSVLSAAAYADDCWYNGSTYPAGTAVAGLVCQPDGTWQRE